VRDTCVSRISTQVWSSGFGVRMDVYSALNIDTLVLSKVVPVFGTCSVATTDDRTNHSPG